MSRIRDWKHMMIGSCVATVSDTPTTDRNNHAQRKQDNSHGILFHAFALTAQRDLFCRQTSQLCVILAHFVIHQLDDLLDVMTPTGGYHYPGQEQESSE